MRLAAPFDRTSAIANCGAPTQRGLLQVDRAREADAVDGDGGIADLLASETVTMGE